MYAQTYHLFQGEVGLKMAVSCLVMADSGGIRPGVSKEPAASIFRETSI